MNYAYLLRPFHMFIVCLAIGVSAHTAQAAPDSPRLISHQLVKSYSVTELTVLWKQFKIPKIVSPIKNAVDVYEVLYYSSWHDGSQIKASGLLFVPVAAAKPASLVAYHHGTQIEKYREYTDRGENMFGVIFAADGYAVAKPDYIGLGKGDRWHLYQNAESEAVASIDLIRTTKELAPQLKLALDGKLFLTGYSQGGHATMATHRKIERDLGGELTVTASAPLSGAYDMIGVQSGVMFREYSHPGYLPYLLLGLAEAYGYERGNPSAILKSPYDTLIPPLINKTYSMNVLDKALPRVPKDAVLDDLVVKFQKKDSTFVLYKALMDNCVYDWKAIAPVQMCYCEADEQVNWQNAKVAEQHMNARGSTLVRSFSAGKRFDHNPCAPFAFIYSKIWFDSIRKGHKAKLKGSAGKRMLIGIAKGRVK